MNDFRIPGGRIASLCAILILAASVMAAASTGDRETVRAFAERPVQQQPEQQPERQQDQDLVVRIETPTLDTFATGPTVIRVGVTPAAGAAVARVTFIVDGGVVAVLEEAPWEITWDAGEGFSRHVITVEAVDATGRQAEDTVVTRDLETAVFRAEVSAVLLYVTVLDGRGAYVPGLEADDFEIYEDGDRQEIVQFSSDPRPMVVGLLLDTSGSMEGVKLERARQGAAAFLDQLDSQDEMFLLAFDTFPRVLQGLTNNRRLVREALEDLHVGGATSMNLAVVDGVDMLADRAERRALIVLSDGYDTTQTVTIDQAVDYARRLDVRVYGIGVFEAAGRGLMGRRRGGFDAINPGETSLRSLADGTGGRAFILDSLVELQRAYEDIAAELRSQYAIAYQPTDPPSTGEWHDIEVRARGGREARTKPGYYGGEQY